jgi:formylmethanofuran dehydrogenase subunit E
VTALVTQKQRPKEELEETLEKAVDFHGHLGPFLVLGIRMGFIGLRELEVKRGNPKLRVTMITKPSVPFSCVIDGIQVATECTVGNRKLKLQDSSGTISARFQLPEGKTATVTLNPAKQEELEKLVSKHLSSQEIEEIARNIILTSERELLKVEK